MKVVTQPQLAIALGREPSDAELDKADQLEPQLVNLLELRLGRWLYRREVVGERHVVGPSGRVHPNHGPVASVTAIDVSWVSGGTSAYSGPLESLDFIPGSEVFLTYVAGEEPTPEVVQGVIIDALVRALVVTAEVGAGVVTSFTVEGESVTYGPVSAASNQQGAGRVPVADLRALDPLLIPTVL